MRKVFSLALMAAMLCLVGMTKDAGATVTLALEWGACNLGCTGLTTNSVNVAPGLGQTLRLDIFMTHDETAGINIAFFSLNFDTDLLNELNIGAMPPVNWAGTDVDPGTGVALYGPVGVPAVSPESSLGVAGRIDTFDSLTTSGLVLPQSGLAYTVGTVTATAPARYRVGQVFFSVNVALTDGVDVFSGLFNTGVDGIYNGLALATVNDFGNASVNLIPEPSTVSLLGLGLVGLVLAGRRSRRS